MLEKDKGLLLLAFHIVHILAENEESLLRDTFWECSARKYIVTFFIFGQSKRKSRGRMELDTLSSKTRKFENYLGSSFRIRPRWVGSFIGLATFYQGKVLSLAISLRFGSARF